ncbi:RpiR family transcriptional regulator, partial [Streptococcus pneumoniae]|nr:RpiR family transcriptional regulator [Streptococcus pneumoniae]
DKGAKTVLMTTRKFDEEDCFFDELLLLASTDHLSYGNRISPQFPILLITDCLFSNYLESPERQYYYNQTIIHKEE